MDIMKIWNGLSNKKKIIVVAALAVGLTALVLVIYGWATRNNVVTGSGGALVAGAVKVVRDQIKEREVVEVKIEEAVAASKTAGQMAAEGEAKVKENKKAASEMSDKALRNEGNNLL